MKNLLLITLLAFYFSCSKNPGEKTSIKTAETPNKVAEVIGSNLTSSVIFDQARDDDQSDSQIVDMGTVNESSINLHRIYLKNSFHTNLELRLDNIADELSGSAFSLERTDCSEQLENDQICFIDIKMVNDSTLSYSPKNLDLTLLESNDYFGKITLVGQRGVKISVKSYQFINVGQLVNIENTVKTVRVYIKNDGDKVINPQITVPAEFVVAKTTCQGTIPKGNVCFIDLKINASIDPNIIGVNKTINFDGSSFAITAGDPAPNESIVCSPSYSNVNNVCQQTAQIRACNPQPANSISGHEESNNGGVSWSSCLNYNCQSLYTNIGGVCTLTNQTQSCTISNGSGQRTSTDAGLTWSTCSVANCNANYTNVSNSCLLTNQVQACTIENGVGSQSSTNGGVSFGTCNVVNCNTNYTNVSNICVDINQIRSCTSQPANSNSGIESSTNGGVSWGACTSYICNSNYTNVAGICIASSQDRSCTISNGTGTQHSTDGGQNYGACSIVNCNSTFMNVADSCVAINQNRSCVITNGTGTQSSTDGGQSYGSCSLVSCNTGYGINNQQCIPVISQFSGYKAWSNDTYAKSCLEYYSPGSVALYSGSTGDSIYRIKPAGSTSFDVYCDMTNGGYTEIFDLVRTSSLNVSQVVAKLQLFNPSESLNESNFIVNANGVYWRNYNTGFPGYSVGITRIAYTSVQMNYFYAVGDVTNQGYLGLHTSNKTGCSANISLGTSCQQTEYKTGPAYNQTPFRFFDSTTGSAGWSLWVENVQYDYVNDRSAQVNFTMSNPMYLTFAGRVEGSTNYSAPFYIKSLKVK